MSEYKLVMNGICVDVKLKNENTTPLSFLNAYRNFIYLLNRLGMFNNIDIYYGGHRNEYVYLIVAKKG